MNQVPIDPHTPAIGFQQIAQIGLSSSEPGGTVARQCNFEGKEAAR